MSTTACDDQLAPEPTFDNHEDSVSMRFNEVSNVSEQLQAMTNRAEAAEAELEAIREDNHSMMLEIHNLRIVIGQLTTESTDAEEM